MQLQVRMTQANSFLAAYAVPHEEHRVFPDTPDDTRFPFQRDRDRIIHTTAFRRLKHKTQVFVAPHSDHYRTRLTHSLEVAQISRDIARTLSLNEDLSEAIALAHDLGHTPFGHAGEEAMDLCMQPFNKHFEHNEQSFRIVTMLEERKPGVFGLNLNREVLDGLLKHSTPHDHPKNPNIPVLAHSPSLEAQIVNLADEIAYTAHDSEDGLRAGLFTLSDLSTLSLIKRIKNKSTIRSNLIDLLVHDVYKVFANKKIDTLKDVYESTVPLIELSPEVHADMREMRAFLWNRMYMNVAVLHEAEIGKNVVKTLFNRYLKHPSEEVHSLQSRTRGALEDAVKDFVAGMTDTYAVEMLKNDQIPNFNNHY